MREQIKERQAVERPILTNQEADILAHASQNNGRYVTTEQLPLSLAERGYFENRGKWALAGGAYALAMTMKGREALSEWRAAQPKPKQKRRRQSPAFESWRRYCDANGRFGFAEFLKDVWPHVQRGRYFA